MEFFPTDVWNIIATYKSDMELLEQMPAKLRKPDIFDFMVHSVESFKFFQWDTLVDYPHMVECAMDDAILLWNKRLKLYNLPPVTLTKEFRLSIPNLILEYFTSHDIMLLYRRVKECYNSYSNQINLIM